MQAEITSMYTLLKQRRWRWLGHVARMDDGQIPKDLFYGELNQGKRPTNRPKRLRCKDVCWRDLKALGIDINKWETVDSERSAWRQVLQQGPFKRHLPNRLRQRDKQGKPLTRETDQQLTTSAHCAEETVIPELVFPATQRAVRVPLMRARHRSLSRLKQANGQWQQSPFQPAYLIRSRLNHTRDR